MADRVEKIRARIAEEGVEAIVVASPTNRRYLTGFTGTAGTAVISKDAAYLLTDFRYVEQVKLQAPFFELVEYSDPIEGLAETLKDAKVRKVAFEADHTTVKVQKAREEACGDTDWTATEGLTEGLRAIKDPAELEALQAAVDLADRAFSYICERIADRTERDVAFDLEMFMRREGAEKLAFPSIIASGPNGALPHAVPGERTVKKGDLVTLDLGCVVDGYCSDMTRTVVVGSPSGRQREIYDLVLAAQQCGVEAVRPGRTGREVDAVSREVIGDAGLADRFGHGLGHGVGLEVHEDPPRLSPRSEGTLSPGMVTSVEPGIYIPGWGGVRIEDLVVVTDGGCRTLTQSSKELIEL